MHRRKPASAKQRKAQLQLKRAVKRGDVPPPDPQKHVQKTKSRRRDVDGPSRRLQSSFIKLPPRFLEETKSLAATITLSRPIAPSVAVFDDQAISREQHGTPGVTNDNWFSLPKRPKWRFDMTKEEVEKNEEGLFKKWLTRTDALVEEWVKRVEDSGSDTDKTKVPGKPIPEMPRSPTYFERNIEVWRQLWRVTEISQIILVLLDSRCPLLHYPPCLSSYLSGRKVIIVLTKVDISGPARADAWSAYFHSHHPGLRVVQVEAFVEKEASAGHQGRALYQPHLPEGFRHRLVDAIKEVHAELLEPPEKFRANEQKLARWKSSVKKDIDWDALRNYGGTQEGSIVAEEAMFQLKDEDNLNDDTLSADSSSGEPEPKFLTIGLIGQPNVGKSSLLNAMFNTHKVRASKTPGKTKHFQTLFWTPDVRLVDCPGLVMPNFVPMEMQVLCGILPISRVAAIPSCVHHAAQHLPLEQIYRLTHPALNSPPVEDKRTWRDGKRPSDKRHEISWTTTDLLMAFAESKGWLTAKAGRPDIHRAGNAILRALAEGRIGWAFWPPHTAISTITMHSQSDAGIWIPHIVVKDEEESEEDMAESQRDETSASEEYDVVDALASTASAGFGRFGALSLEDPLEDSSSDEGSE